MCFKYLHDAAADPVYPGDPVPLLLLAERYRLPTVRYQAWAKVVSALPSVQHTPSYSRLASDTRQAMRNLRYNIMCAFETVGRLVFQLYPNECGCRGQALSDWYERTGSAWVDSWKWDAEGSLRLSFAVPQLGTCEAHAEEQLMRHVEVQQCWVAEQELYDGLVAQRLCCLLVTYLLRSTVSK